MSETKIFSSKHCAPCHQVVQELEAQGNQIDGEPVIVVDVETEAGFQEFEREVLRQGDGAVPTAFRDGERCQIVFYEEGGVGLKCPSDPSSPPDESVKGSDHPEAEPL